MKMDINHHGPRLMPNNCKNLNLPFFSLPTTFKYAAYQNTVNIVSTWTLFLFFTNWKPTQSKVHDIRIGAIIENPLFPVFLQLCYKLYFEDGLFTFLPIIFRIFGIILLFQCLIVKIYTCLQTHKNHAFFSFKTIRILLQKLKKTGMMPPNLWQKRKKYSVSPKTVVKSSAFPVSLRTFRRNPVFFLNMQENHSFPGKHAWKIRARICKRFRSPGIDSKESISTGPWSLEGLYDNPIFRTGPPGIDSLNAYKFGLCYSTKYL